MIWYDEQKTIKWNEMMIRKIPKIKIWRIESDKKQMNDDQKAIKWHDDQKGMK
jgi:hypothetical protein